MNPCRCGYLGDESRSCSRAPRCGVDYQSKVSGPLIDRMDIIIDVTQIDIFGVEKLKAGEPSKQVALRVASARKIQNDRYQNEPNMNDIASKTNAMASSDLIDKYIVLDDESRNILKKAVKMKQSSMRSYVRILKVARTIADLDQSHDVTKFHILEALNYKK
jgi:magnesium chelatase family protein